MGIRHSDLKVSGDKGYASEWNKDHIIDTNVPFNQFQATEFVVENRTDWPAGPVAGQKVFRTDLLQEYVYNGTGWITSGTTTFVVVAIDGTGNFTDIQTAITSLGANGGTVYVKEGVYTITSTINVNWYISLIGDQRTILRAELNDAVFTVSNSALFFSMCGFEIRGNTGAGGANTYGIKLDGISKCHIFNNFFTELEGGEIYDSANSNEIFIHDNTFYSRGPYSIFLHSASSAFIYSNRFINSTTSTIRIEHASNLHINNNDLENCDGHGIHIGSATNDSHDIIISGNSITDCGTGGVGNGVYFEQRVDNSIISNNVILRSDIYNVNIANANCDNNMISNNRMDDTGSTANINDVGTGTQTNDNLLT